jgi:serine-type D-Ala-D-Ala endopeptidase (penicillin-binding protein 7)
LNRILHTVALGAFVLALFPATSADAAQPRRAAKKPAVVKTARVAKTFKSGPRMQAAAKRRPIVAVAPPKPSFGQLAGLHGVQDELDLKSSVAYVIDQDTREVLVRKNDAAVLPIASITKLMTGLIVSEAKLPLDETIAITDEDVDTEKHSSSRLKVGTTLTRREAMHLALMSSENRAAHALGRTFPGGMAAFVSAMNTKARQLGMKDTQYVEPTGLSSRNQSSAQDLATLVNIASHDALLREFSTSHGTQVEVGNRLLAYNNTNRLVRNPNWEIGLQKTGYISEAGQCLVMQVKVAGRKLIMVFLDSAGKLSRIGDAERVRKWLETTGVHVPAVAPPAVNTVIRQVSG